jgi:pimeloyl-ACP methyl ester carboxylesterase
MATKEKATWRDPALEAARELELPQGRLRYFEAGSGSPIVFRHGLLVNANLWRKVGQRCRPSSAASRSTCRSARTRCRCHMLPT